MPLKRFISASATAILCCFSLLAQNGATGGTAEDFVRIALERNQDYLAASERVREAEALVRQAGLRPDPTIEIETATGAIFGSHGESEYSAAYFQPIETGGQRAQRLAIAEKGLALTQAEVREKERQLTYEVGTHFVTAALEEVKLATMRSLAPATKENYQFITQRVQLGDAAPLEQQLLLVAMNRIEAQQALRSAAGEAAVAELRASAGLPGTEPVRVIPEFRLPERIPALETLQQAALQQRGDIQILKLLEEQADAETALATAEGHPDVTVSARYARVSSAFDQFGLSGAGTVVPLNDTDNIVTFGVSIPLFTRKRARGMIDAAESRQVQQRLRREHLMRVVPQEVEAAYRRWSGATRSLEILRTGVIEPFEKNLTVIREAYRLGQLRLLDVLNEQRQLVDLRLAYVETQAEAARALIELERAVGGTLP